MAQIEREAPEPFTVNHDAWQAWDVFLSCWTQFNRNDFTGTIIGLSYPAVESVMRMKGVKRKDQSECFELIRAAEGGFLAGRNKRLLEETFNDEPEFEYTCLASRRLEQVMLERSVSQSLARSGNSRFGIHSMG